MNDSQRDDVSEPGVSPPPRFTILAVDDAPENLDVLVANLRDLYQVRFAANGLDAVKVALRHKPDLILMDVEMPHMDGFEACRQIKAHPETEDIPVLFVTSLSEVGDETTGFDAGGVDYLTKPISPPILRARVKTHLELREARRSVQNVLNQTLSGTISVMSEVLGMANPTAFGRATRMRRIVRDIVRRIGRADAWQFELAAMLSQLGCVSLPAGVLKKIHHGVMANPEEQARYDSYPDLSAKLVARIPRLNEVAEMVVAQLAPPRGPWREDLKSRPAVALGAQLLKLAMDYDTLQLAGTGIEAIIHRFAMDKQRYDPALVALFADVVQAPKNERHLMVRELRAGMTLVDDLATDAGEIVLKKGTDLTPSVLNLLTTMAEHVKFKQPIAVMSSV